MGARVSVVPNPRTLRSTPMNTRRVVVLSRTFGSNMYLRVFSEEVSAKLQGCASQFEDLAARAACELAE